MLTERNRQAVDAVRELLTRKPVAFIGSGLTQPHYPSWTKLLAILGQELGITADGSHSPMAQAELFYTGNRDGYAALLVKLFGEVPDNCRPGLRDLVKLDLSACVTTNYDYSIWRAIRGLGREPDHWRYPHMQVSDCQQPQSIFFLHGAVAGKQIENLDNFVLHETAYRKAYLPGPDGRAGPLLAFLYDLFNLHDILFIGYGADKAEPMRFALEYSQKRRVASRRRLLLAPASRPTEEKDVLKARYGVDVVEYDPLDENHSGLDEIICEIYQQQIIPPPGFTHKPFDGLDLTGAFKK